MKLFLALLLFANCVIITQCQLPPCDQPGHKQFMFFTRNESNAVPKMCLFGDFRNLVAICQVGNYCQFKKTIIEALGPDGASTRDETCYALIEKLKNKGGNSYKSLFERGQKCHFGRLVKSVNVKDCLINKLGDNGNQCIYINDFKTLLEKPLGDHSQDRSEYEGDYTREYKRYIFKRKLFQNNVRSSQKRSLKASKCKV
uniref:Uncharacterized protein n=1 Tax=Romanomermis culicivorax TaxID=13658 RepID=A0A915J3G3_ROMCU